MEMAKSRENRNIHKSEFFGYSFESNTTHRDYCIFFVVGEAGSLAQ